MNSYEAKQERRRQGLNRAADKARAEAESRFGNADRIGSVIPMGQPILVGHHSERRHRRDLARIDDNMRKGVEATKRAEELQRRAEAVGSNGISSDDPEAVEKLGDKVAELEALQARYKLANKLYKAGDVAGLAAIGIDYDKTKAEILRVHHWDPKPFTTSRLTNLAARIRAAKKRATIIERVAAMPATVETIGTATLSVEPDENRVILQFRDRLSSEHYKAVRSAGFVWARTRSAFVRKLGTNAIWSGRQVAERIAKDLAS